MKGKNKYKTDFKKELDKFADKLGKYASTDNGDWTVKGFIDAYKNIYTISSDTKIISKSSNKKDETAQSGSRTPLKT